MNVSDNGETNFFAGGLNNFTCASFQTHSIFGRVCNQVR